MKKMRLAALAALALTLTAALVGTTGCQGKRQEVAFSGDTIRKIASDLRMAVSDLMPDNEEVYVTDTIPPFCVTDHGSYYAEYTEEGLNDSICTDSATLLTAPSLRVTEIQGQTFLVSSMDRSVVIDFSDTADVKRLALLDSRPDSFSKFSYQESCDYISYWADVYFPASSVPHADAISRWIVDELSDAPEDPSGYDKPKPRYKDSLGNRNRIFKFLAQAYFKPILQTYDEEDMSLNCFGIDLRARLCNDKYVTYQENTFQYSGGLHGYHAERLLSFDHVHRKPIDNDYLFRPNTQADVLYQIMQVAQKDHNYKTANADITDYAFVTDDEGKRTGEIQIPTPGLSEKGFVFSFQPYEICYYAAGAFHFTVPFKALRPYLTDRAKWCLGL